MVRKLAVFIPVVCIAFFCSAQDDKSAATNGKIVDKEENHFRKELSKTDDSGAVYLEHADVLAGIVSECGRAGDFYKLALKYDTMNPTLYKNYGKYLGNVQRVYSDAKVMLEKALKLAPDDAEIKVNLESVDKILAAQDEDNRLKDFGSTRIRELNPTEDFAVLTKFDSLRKESNVPASKYNYEQLLARFLTDDTTLTPDEMYMMIVGFSVQSTYNPFNYNDINDLKRLACHDVDTAIRKGIELTKINPLNPSLNRELMYCYRKKGNMDEGEKYRNRIKLFFNGVLYSGNGTCGRPYVSLWAKEEYNFITYLGYTSSPNHSMGMCGGQMAETIDMVNPADQKTEQINFNVGLIYMQSVGK